MTVRHSHYSLVSARCRWAVGVLLLTAGVVLAVAACQGPSREPAAELDGDTPGAMEGPCPAGHRRSCVLVLPAQAGVESCVTGVQICDDDGNWTACQHPEGASLEGAVAADGSTRSLVRRLLGPPRGLGRAALSAPGLCDNNPCNPDCRIFTEEPDSPIIGVAGAPGAAGAAGGPSTPAWVTGTLTELTPDVPEACYSAADCPGGQVCRDVATLPGCSHDKCDTGDGLRASCDPCVQEVCERDASCCVGPCGPDEVLSLDGERCYRPYYSATVTWGTAQAACEAIGTGWHLAVPRSAGEESEIAGLLGSNQAWIGLADRSGTGSWVGADGSAVSYLGGLAATPPSAEFSCVELSPGGSRSTQDCDDTFNRFVCAGPSGASTSCAHDPCEVGAALGASCDSCVSTVCATHPECCTTGWDAACVGYVATECSRSCGCDMASGEVAGGDRCYYSSSNEPTGAQTVLREQARSRCQARGPGWDLVVIDDATEEATVTGVEGSEIIIGADDLTTEGTLAWVNGAPGHALSFSVGNDPGRDCVYKQGASSYRWDVCTLERRYVCEGPRSVTPTWSQACVDLVEDSCGATCPADPAATPAQDATCGLSPGASSCAGWDVALDVPCGTDVPVCNRGSVDAPAGLVIHALPPGQLGSPRPDLSGATTCTVADPIPAGTCQEVSCAGIVDGEELVINPRTGASHQAGECGSLDNWTVFRSGVGCEAPRCFATVVEPTPAPDDVFIVVENTSPMGSSAATKVLVEDFIDALDGELSAAAIEASLELVPLDFGGNRNEGCANNNVCSEKERFRCGNPAALEGEVLTSAFNFSNLGQHPAAALDVALEGALIAQRADALASPGSRQAVVFIGAGKTTDCGVDEVDLVRQYREEWGISTYVVGVNAHDQPLLDDLAAAGGTTPLTLTGAGADAATIVAALTGEATPVGCTVPLENVATLDHDGTQLVYLGGAGGRVPFLQVGDATACAGSDAAWYHDDPMAPTALVLCPDACTRVQADAGGRLVAEVACGDGTAPIPPAPPTYTVVTERYEASCDDDQLPQWGFLAFESQTPEDSRIVISARTAGSEGDLPMASSRTLVTIDAATGNERCDFTDSCLVDVFAALGGRPDALEPHLELQVELFPSTSGVAAPVLEDWRLTYSCPPAQ